MKAIHDCALYGILDGDYSHREQAGEIVKKMIAGGIDILQLRAKNWSIEEITQTAREVHPLTQQAGVPLIINDYPEVASQVGAEGVHVGQDDLSVKEVRELLGENILVGLSSHSLQQANEAAKQEVDYIGFGPLFSTATKPDYAPIGTTDIAQIHQDQPTLPIFCIGGIKKDNAPSVLAAGAQRLVVVSGILQADDIEAYTRQLKSLL
ncbi:MAG: thiamine phosphate synthase [Verrucomicrobiales bacterium]|nr:thiamine phosphate synthase [Verrucomicrobiales bacterium]